MPATDTFTVNATGDPEPVVVISVCTEVIIGEDQLVAGWPTTPWMLRMPDKTSDAVGKAVGATHVFRKPNGCFFQPGEIAGYAELPSGSTTFYQIEI